MQLVKDFETKSSWIRVGPKSNNWCPYKKRRRHRETHIWGRRSFEDEAEIGVMLPQAKECLGPPEAETGREGPSLEPSEGAWPC